ncbi:dihydroxy-acid dehydratase [Leptolyngbya sp. 15MV]|nr:dihydroxy-acid dehydratase [Leptolyngbya sp. 15MV]
MHDLTRQKLRRDVLEDRLAHRPKPTHADLEPRRHPEHQPDKIGIEKRLRDGDLIRLDVTQRRLDLLGEEAELARRRAAWVPPPRRYARGWTSLYLDQVTQADEGCDLRVLEGQAATPEPDIY